MNMKNKDNNDKNRNKKTTHNSKDHDDVNYSKKLDEQQQKPTSFKTTDSTTPTKPQALPRPTTTEAPSRA